MILFDPVDILPSEIRPRFRIFQFALFFLFLVIGTTAGFFLLFPSRTHSFDFRHPDSSKNTLETVLPDDISGGKIPADRILRSYAGTVGDFSSVRFEMTLEPDSDLPENAEVTVRRSYRSFFLPDGEPANSHPEDRVLAIDGMPYLFSEETILPFISDAAALSWTPKEQVLPASDEILSVFPPNDGYAGFRPGSLLSDAQGVYAVDSDGLHPVGSVDVFEVLGFHWDDVIRVSEEELGVTERRKMLTEASGQPDGTLFHDRSENTYFLIEDGTRRAVTDTEYRDDLLVVTTPIEADGAALGKGVTCTAVLTFPSFRRRYACEMPLDELTAFPGNSFEFSLAPEEDITPASIAVTFRTRPDRENLSLFLRKLKERFVTVYGAG